MHKIENFYLFILNSHLFLLYTPQLVSMRGLARNGILYLDSWAVYTKMKFISICKEACHIKINIYIYSKSNDLQKSSSFMKTLRAIAEYYRVFALSSHLLLLVKALCTTMQESFPV